MIQLFKDLLLEVRIQMALNALLAEPNRTKQRQIAARMADLVKQRSPGRVERMERAKGIQ